MRLPRFLLLLLVPLAAAALALPGAARGVGDILESQQALPDKDARSGTVQPTVAQEAIVSSLGAHATWNQFGTPASLINYGGYLATGLSSDPVTAARGFISSNKALFRLSDQGVANLELLNDSKMAGYDGHAVLFRQTFGGLPATQDGLISVGVVGGKVAYVSSSAAGNGNAPASPVLSPQQAWLLAAANVGQNLSILALSAGKGINGWLTFHAAGLNDLQRVRLVAMPTPTDGVRPAYEAIVLNVQDTGAASAYTVFVDAVNGTILFRHNDVQQAANLDPGSTCDSTGHNCAYQGTMTGTSPGQCGPAHGPYPAPANTKSIDAAANADVATNDIELDLLNSSLNVVTSSDVATSPEAVHYEPNGGIAAGTVFYTEVCPSPNPAGPFLDPLSYHGSITFNDVAGTQPPLVNTPKWKAFKANPSLNTADFFPWNNPSTDTRIVWCWLDSLSGVSPADANCQYAVKNIASRLPWDAEPHTGVTTDTTTGNNATTGEAWLSPLTAGGTHQQPMHPDRAYIDPWNSVWSQGSATAPGHCNPGNLVPGGNDILASVTNLFVGHNRMHDFAYHLGFTETNFNAQTYNFGNTAPGPYPAGREGDPEEGDVQAGAVDGGAPSYLGRDNANQITLNDGIPPITNQYLFQPIAGAFYSPCVDGDFDTSVFGHEYTHLISNRMVAGPDAGLSGYQAGSMGESWSDLDAVEYLNENGFVPTNGENPFSVGAYVTGNKSVGIRDYALNQNPLNYSDLGFDTPGPEVHADGEIWNGTNFDIRQALINKYNASFPASDAALQKRCADGVLPADQCPGDRRWIQTMYDAWLLMQSGVSMLDARDAYLAADMMRFGGANQTELWHAFAQRGMGTGASTNGTADSDPKPSFASPNEPNATITFNVTAADGGNAPVAAKIFVGNYEARVTPIADTDAGTTLSATAKFVPGAYDFVAQAPGYGLFRVSRTFTANQTATLDVAMPTNWASSSKGATASGDGSDQTNLIDDTEGTQWSSTAAPVAGKQVTVQLGGGAHTINRVQVSAMLQAGQNRFSAVRTFEIWTCTASVANGNCTTGFTKVFTSADDAFPGVAPRPVAPNLIMRSFNLPAPVSATHVRLVVDTSQCTGGPAYAGEQDSDPTNSTDCTTQSSHASEVRAAELEVFGSVTADLSIVKTGPPTGHVGQPMTYTIGVTNNGPETANGVLVTDTLPKNTGFGSATSTQGTCAPRPHSQSVDCNVGTMASGATVTITIVAKPTQKGTYVNTATVSATSPPDPNTANNTSSVTTNVTP